ncbi:hypothetical protein [Rheinheimera sp.]|uniref:hypothetical protein n=1 Tax=Rheinheimera sp. TaxID=1869214 RepID=UPI00273685BE|nr:hypothetical protein [Rheinheimera sp.]MDP2715812.1 hypothetical protein [Rheinheimera sp.]
MYRILSDTDNLKQVFSAFSTTEALLVKHNIQWVFQQLNVPSPALLAQMRAEGLSLSAFEPAHNSDTELQYSSDTVLRAHLTTMFLAEKQLHAAMSMLTLSQQVEVRDLLNLLSEHLRLPSDTLLQRMADEGLTLEKLGVAGKPLDKLAQIREKLKAAGDNNPAKSVEDVKRRLAILHGDVAKAEQNETSAAGNIIHLTAKQERLSGSR